jgi:hypothetical protein
VPGGERSPGEGPRLRILFFLLHPGYAAVYEPVLRLLAERGHAVHLAFAQTDRAPKALRVVEQLAAELPGVTHGPAPQRGGLDGWRSVSWLVRGLADLARYEHPRFDAAPAVRERMRSKVVRSLEQQGGLDPVTRRAALELARALSADGNPGRAERAVRVASTLERAVPTCRRIDRFVARFAPDVVLATPLVELASAQVDYLKSARRLRIPCGICVASWDNLTGKGLLRFVPERVFVWNETQRREASDLHRIPADRVVATGAPRFDEWFERRPGSTRPEFVRKIGLDPERPFVLYLCSSAFIVGNEVAFVLRWLDALRRAPDERLRRAGVAIRPYPVHARQWEGVDLSGFDDVVLWPREGSHPDHGEADARADFFDSIAHSVAVVGVNTSAMIEAAILGKSVFTVLVSEFAQETTIHFHYLVRENGGFLDVAPTLDDHVVALARALDEDDRDARRRRGFVESFVRPAGIDRPAAPILADSIEQLAALPPDPAGSGLAVVARPPLALVAAASTLSILWRSVLSAARSRRPRERRGPTSAASDTGRS